METSTFILHSIIYISFFAASWYGKIQGFHRLINDNNIITTKLNQLIGLQILGVLLFGGLPVIFRNDLHELKTLLSINVFQLFLLMICFFAISIIAIIAFKQSQNAFLLNNNLNSKTHPFKTSYIGFYFALRIMFLASYELWFRGYLLSDFKQWVGIPLAIFINIILYVLIHIFNSRKEAFGCFPFGIMLCILAIYSNSALPAIIIHIVFSLTYEISLTRLINNKLKILMS